MSAVLDISESTIPRSSTPCELSVDGNGSTSTASQNSQEVIPTKVQQDEHSVFLEVLIEDDAAPTSGWQLHKSDRISHCRESESPEASSFRSVSLGTSACSSEDFNNARLDIDLEPYTLPDPAKRSLYRTVFLSDSDVGEGLEDKVSGKDVKNDSVVILSYTQQRLVPPDGGFGWVVVAATFLITFLLTGFLKSFGEFRALLFKEFPDTTSAEASWITALKGTFPLLIAPVTGILINTFGFRKMVFAGGLLCSTGLGISYFVTHSGFLIGSIGTLMGIGSSFAVTSSVVCVGRYFTSRRPTALAFALSGSCFGAMALPTAYKCLLGVLGLRYTFAALAGLYSLISVVALAFGPPENRFRRELVEVIVDNEKKAGDPSTSILETVLNRLSKFLDSLCTRLALKFLINPTFLITASSVGSMTMGSHFLGSTIAHAKALGVDGDAASMLLAYAAIGDLAIRLTYGILANRSPFSRTLEYVVAITLSAISIVAIPFCTEFWQLIVIAVVSGFTMGMYTIMIPLLLSNNLGSEYMSSTFTLVKLWQAGGKIIYQPVSQAIKSTWGLNALLYFFGSQISLALLLSILLHVVVTVRRR